VAGVRDPAPGSPGAGRLDAAFLLGIDRRLADADRLVAARYPGDAGDRQPLHTVYVPADQVGLDTPARWGARALDLLAAAVPDAPSATRVTGLDGVDEEVHRRVRAKLAGQPVEDLRVDFEDGYGARPDAEEDAAAASAGTALAGLLTAPGGPSFAGIRFKSLEPPTRRRGLRTIGGRECLSRRLLTVSRGLLAVSCHGRLTGWHGLSGRIVIRGTGWGVPRRWHIIRRRRYIDWRWRDVVWIGIVSPRMVTIRSAVGREANADADVNTASPPVTEGRAYGRHCQHDRQNQSSLFLHDRILHHGVFG